MSALRLRCAIYTRKSTEEGLDQDYNSLEAQRDACVAYITSQAGEGWTVVKTPYDDGGLSGATMERPALKHLLADIKAGTIDVVMVYKVDRLTRSLADFAKIVEILDAEGVSFVSVTQQFNTTSSMGRLTLNVLLSFAQFEREVTAERIRDKIAASKKKGMWMGGVVPLGYDVVDRKLVVNEEGARTVRALFELYLKVGTVQALRDEADRRGLVTKIRPRRNGRETGGKPFTRGNLYHILRNPLYVGRIPHKTETYVGQHMAIVDSEVWSAVQLQLAQHATWRQRNSNMRSPSLLTGLAFDETGDRLCPTYTNKKGRRYRYYISKRLMHDAHRHDDGWRLPAATLEDTVCDSIRLWLRDQQRLVDSLRFVDQKPSNLIKLVRQAEGLARNLDTDDIVRRRDSIQLCVIRIRLTASSITITFDRAGLAKALGFNPKRFEKGEIPFAVPLRLRRRGVEARLIMGRSELTSRSYDPCLCHLIFCAQRWFRNLAIGEPPSIRAIARREGIHECDVGRHLRLACLAPDIVEAILDGRQPIDLTAEKLRRLPHLPANWESQRRLLGFRSR